MTASVDTERAEYIAGLRAFADWLDRHPAVPLPTFGEKYNPVLWSVANADDQKAALAAIARAYPGLVAKNYDTQWLNLPLVFGGFHIEAYASRDQVCERVVTGTETVTKKVKDPDALAAVPEVEVTETVETVEWVCAPLLSEAVAS